MAIVTYNGERKFGKIVPTHPTIDLIDWPEDDESIWKQVSGNWKQIGGANYALYRHAGTLFLRFGTVDVPVDDRTRTERKVADMCVGLRVFTSAGIFEVSETIPEWLWNDPTSDHLSCDDHLWTYMVHSVLNEPDGRNRFWGFSGF